MADNKSQLIPLGDVASITYSSLY